MHVEHVVHGDDAEEAAFAVGDGEGVAVVFFESADGGLGEVGGFEGDVARVVEIADERVCGREEDFADADVVYEATAFVGDVNDVERLGVLPEFADVLQHLLDAPSVADGDEIGRHEAAHAALGVIEELLGNFAFLRREEREELGDGVAREFFEERGAVVGGHFVEHGRRLLTAHGLEELLLGVGLAVFKDIRRQCMWQDAEDDSALVFRQFDDEFRSIHGRKFRECLAQPREVAASDHVLNFRS